MALLFSRTTLEQNTHMVIHDLQDCQVILFRQLNSHNKYEDHLSIQMHCQLLLNKIDIDLALNNSNSPQLQNV